MSRLEWLSGSIGGDSVLFYVVVVDVCDVRCCVACLLVFKGVCRD